MDSVNSINMSDNMDIPTTCEQSIQLTKMEVVDQNNVHLENSNSDPMVEAQYINIHRVSDLTKNLTADSIPAELLTHHVIDLGSNPEYSQHIVTNAQFYNNADYISQSFSVAVQFIQPNRNNNESADNLNDDLLNNKATLPSVSSLSTDKAVLSTIIPNYVQTVDSAVSVSQPNIDLHISANHAHVSEQNIDKESEEQNDHQIIKLYQPLVQDNKLQINHPMSRNTKYITSSENNCNSQSMMINSNLNSIQQMTQQVSDNLSDVKTEDNRSSVLSSDINESVHAEDFESDDDNEARSSQKSLPHKKRIPSKLKKALTSDPPRNIHAKCYKCTKCGEQFPTQATFNVHKLQQHSSRKVPYTCELCNKTCSNQLKFFEHLKSHYEPGMIPEDFKNDTSQTTEQPSFDQNTNIHSQESNENNNQLNENQDHVLYSAEQHKVFTCNKCGRMFRRQKAFDCHMSISHPKKEDIEEFSDPEDMMEGIRDVVNMVPGVDDEDKNYEPWQAPKNIENVKVSQQLPQDNSSSTTTTKCFSNSKETSQIKNESKEFPDEELTLAKPRKEMKCPHCERTFVHRNSLLYHIRSHTGHRPHQCELCGKSFFASGALKIHLRLHSGDRPYKCEYCGRFFRQWGDLKYHITSLHSNTKMFQCEYCGKDFARKYSLVVHRRIHTGEKNYICEYCTKTFRAASYLQNHRRIHTGEKPHMCQVCGKPFRVRSDMKRHMKTHPVNLNETQQTSQTGSLNSQRDGIEEDRENTNNGTLYVWIQSETDSILPDT